MQAEGLEEHRGGGPLVRKEDLTGSRTETWPWGWLGGGGHPQVEGLAKAREAQGIIKTQAGLEPKTAVGLSGKQEGTGRPAGRELGRPG